ncbi:TonB-dependent receptor [Dysgonomonas sp. GY75]|uniref:SusC/RagA family TonB-linked outer membrane protein n=1 Tax=Dysgonomonas sp. GY75 TaxID=2780419 RepID=UPI001883CFDD|nr:TonB-dependent receptor [Dysgonomonas sp. GY75]MBF0650052.1 TonB-dependent receptor [Dysgonomonas sp. GY75]
MKRLTLLFISIQLFAFAFGQQQFQLKGKVSSTDGELLAGVSVTIDGTTNGTMTDSDGNYTLTVKSGDQVTFSFISFTKQSVKITNQKILDIILRPDQTALDEVVVVGYGKVKKITLTGAVSAMSAEDIRTVPTSSVQNALAGKLPGFFSQQRSGQPGKDASDFFIRGVSSLNEEGNQPLIIVDDVQYTYDQLQQINVNEIESISILKDASTTAIYGIKGANGVLVVKTRRGEEGRPRINVRLEGGLTMPIRTPKFLNAYEAASLTNEAFVNDGLESSKPFNDTDLEHFRLGDDPYGHPDVNWYKEIFKDVASQQNANVDISGGTKRLRYFVTGGFFSQNGLTRNFEDPYGEVNTDYFYRRFNFRSNLDFDVTSTTKVRLDMSSRFMNINEPNGLNAVGEIYNFKNMTPFSAPLKNPNGTYAYHNYFFPDSKDPTLNARLANEGYSRTRRFDSNILFDVSQNMDFVTKGLSGMLRVAYSSIDENSRRMWRAKDMYPTYHYTPSEDGGTYTINPTVNSYAYEKYVSGAGINKAIRDLNIQTFINYERTFNEDHNFSGMLLYNRQSRTRDWENVPFFSQPDVPAKFVGYTGQIKYNYKNRYLFDLNTAYNGTDRFSRSKRFGWFPSAAAGWNIGEEPFFQEKFGSKIDMLKIRASYGLVGSDAASGGRYLYKQYYEQGGGYSFGENYNNTMSSYKEGSLADESVTWEKARKFDVGIDASLLNNKISFTLDYFYDFRYDQLVERSDVSLVFGLGSARKNIGETSNQGFDGQIGYTDKFGDFNFNTNLVFSYAKNKVKYKAEAQQRYPWLAETGKPIGQPFGYTWLGYYTQQDIDEINAGNPNKIPVPSVPVSAGDLKYMDLNGDGAIDDFDKSAIGKPNLPTTTLGFTIGGSYKGFSLNLLFQGSFDYSFSVVGTGIESFKSQFQPIHLKRWTQERYDNGEVIDFPRLTTNPSTVSSSEAYMSDFWLVNAWYIRLKTIDLGYELPKSVLPKGIYSTRFYMNAYNLFTKTNYDKYQQDPEIKTNSAGDAYMNQRVVNFGVQMSF